jgi:hypothetical protein
VNKKRGAENLIPVYECLSASFIVMFHVMVANVVDYY